MYRHLISITQLIFILHKQKWSAYLLLTSFVLISPHATSNQPNWVLSGTFINDEDAHAMFVDEQGDELIVELGDQIQGCNLVDVLKSSAKIRCDKNEHILQIRSSVGDILLQAEYENSLINNKTVILSKDEVDDYVKQRQRVVSEIGFLPLIEGLQVVGFTLSKIRPDTKAALLGLNNGDIIKSVNGVPASESHEFMQTVEALAEVQKVTIEIDRYGQNIAYTYILE